MKSKEEVLELTKEMRRLMTTFIVYLPFETKEMSMYAFVSILDQILEEPDRFIRLNKLSK